LFIKVREAPMGLDLLDLFFRLERTFAIRIERVEIEDLFRIGQRRDITVGELFGIVRSKIPLTSLLLDEEIDTELIWSMFQRALSDSLGVDTEEITKEKWILHEFGGW
jgi:hypothetical protein